MWRAVRELYYKDLVIEALAEADKLGGFDSNDIFAEALVRRDGKTWVIRKWLTVEVLPGEAGANFDAVLDLIGVECEDLSQLFGWDNREGTVVAFLPSIVEAEWMPARWGYFVDKVPYDKICLPHHLLQMPRLLRKAIRHEFMHAITLNLCNGHDPRWLAEAMSTLVEGRISGTSWNHFQMSPRDWLNPAHLIGMLTTDHREPEKASAVTLAYDQSSFLGLFLFNDGGAERIGRMLRAIGEESILTNVELQILGRTRADGALRRVYRLSEDELFAKTLGWIRSGRVPEPPF